MDYATESRWTHPALALSYQPSADVHADLYAWFFEHHVFTRWCRKHIEWQLHCVGNPGSGKTTLAALAAQFLRRKFASEGHPIISIFVTEDVLALENEFLEDFLDAIYRALENGPRQSEDLSGPSYDEYKDARFVNAEGSRVSHRIRLLRKAMYERLRCLHQHHRVFLIFDGVDCFSPTLRLVIEMELSTLQSHGVNVMLTSRIAVFEQGVAKCEHEEHGDPSNPIAMDDRAVLDTYFICKTCEAILCFECEDAGRVCGNCHSNVALHEHYDHVNVIIDHPETAMTNYIAWDLEREHGDLGLKSTAHKPPQSFLGMELFQEGLKAAEEIVEDIQDLAKGHIGLAKARLDLVHEAESLSDYRQKRYQLPANIQALFDAAMRGLEARGPLQRDLGIKAIAASARSVFSPSVPEVQDLLHRSITPATRSGEDIVEAAKGFIFATPLDDPQRLMIFHPTFRVYVMERYNESLYHEIQAMDEDDRSRRESYDTPTFSRRPTVRFEPQSTTDEPSEMTAFKLNKTATMSTDSRNGPKHPYLFRSKGTMAWQ